MDTRNLKRGDIVNTAFGIAVVLDVMRSVEGESATIYVQFARSIGRTHPDGDAIRIMPGDLKGVDKWEFATLEELQAAIEQRRNSLEREIQKVVELVQERQLVMS